MRLNKPIIAILAVLMASFIGACSSSTTDVTGGNCKSAKCDTTFPEEYQSNWTVDMAKLNVLWPGQPLMTSIKDAYRVKIVTGKGDPIISPTHLFGSDKPVNVIPYANGDNVKDVDGNVHERGDSEIAKAFPPGQIGFAIKHHSPEHRLITPTALETLGADGLKELMKLSDTHIEIVVGVPDRAGAPGVITLNNPQTYEGGRFGTADYSMIFVRPDYPRYLNEKEAGGKDLKQAFNDNIRTMMLAMNAVSNFPGNYNGGDPLAAHTVPLVREHVKQMILAVAGNAQESYDARAWYEDPKNLVYCAELAFLSATAGMLVPLNEANVVPLLGGTERAKEIWENFAALMKSHNEGGSTPLTTLNDNPLAKMVKGTLAPDEMRPAPEYADPADVEAERQKLAFKPMTMGDIVERALQTYLPRKDLGEEIAPVQAAALQLMRPGLYDAMGLNDADLPRTAFPDDEAGQAQYDAAVQARATAKATVDTLYDQLVAAVGVQYADYDTFRATIAPLLGGVAQITGPRPGSEPGKAFFTPPSLLHLVARGMHPGGLLGLSYVAHGIHFNYVRKSNTTEPNPIPDGTLLDKHGESVAHRAENKYVVEVAEGQEELRITVEVSEGDADLFVKFGEEASYRKHDCKSEKYNTQTETCVITNPEPGKYHITVDGWWAASEYNVKAITASQPRQ